MVFRFMTLLFDLFNNSSSRESIQFSAIFFGLLTLKAELIDPRYTYNDRVLFLP